MATLVFLHAHPDDEATSTAGTMARATDDGHRVVIVYATNGAHGEAAPDDDNDVVTQRRLAAEGSAASLGTARIEWLGYNDSGMTGWEANADPNNFMNADVNEAARRVAQILDEEDADALIGYDDHGNYGHPDHIQVHRVMNAAADLAARRPRLFETTMNRTAMIEMKAAAGPDNPFGDFDPEGGGDDGGPLGTPASEIDWKIDVRPWLAQRRAALECHAAQTSDVGMILQMPAEIFQTVFAYEYYIDRDHHQSGGEPVEGWPW